MDITKWYLDRRRKVLARLVDELSGYSTFAESYRPGEGWPDDKECVSALPSVNIYDTIDVNDAVSYYNGLIGGGSSDYVLFINQYQKGDVDVNSFDSPYGANVGPRHIPSNPDREEDGRSLLVNRTRVAFDMGYLDRMPPEKWDGASYDGPGGIEAPEGTTNWITLPRYPFYDKEDNQHPAGDNDWFGTIDGPNNPGSRVEVFGRPVLAKTIKGILKSLHGFDTIKYLGNGETKLKRVDTKVLLKKRSANIGVTLLSTLPIGGAWRFDVGGYDVYLSAVHGSDDKNVPNVVFDDHTDVKVKCDCPHWAHGGPAYYSGRDGYGYDRDKENRAPKVGGRRYRICKHVYALFEFLKYNVLSKWPESDKRYDPRYKRFDPHAKVWPGSSSTPTFKNQPSRGYERRRAAALNHDVVGAWSGMVESVVNRVIKRGISDASLLF